MLSRSVTRLVDLCIRHPFFTIGLAVVLGLAAALYVGQHFAINTDINDLVSAKLPWRQRSAVYQKAFPQKGIIVVVEAPTTELVDTATNKLAAALANHKDRFVSIEEPASGSFFARNRLLYLSTADVARLTQGLSRSSEFLAILAADPSLRGALDTLSLALAGVEHGQIKIDDMARPLNLANDTIAKVLANRPASFSWQNLLAGKPPSPQQLRRFIEIEPVLNFSALEPGKAASDTISRIAADLKLKERYQAEIHQTGAAAINDSEFSTIQHHALRNGIIALVAVLVILWLALHSPRIMLAAIISVAVGLAISTAVGLLMVGALNLISVAFFTLFIGLSVDFAIQFSVRYRAERSRLPDVRDALRSAAARAGRPLALAAGATAVGFFSFLPTSYRGLSELGLIAGIGMIIAFIVSVTLLPALLSVLNPPREPRSVGFSFLAPVDHFLQRYRIPIVVGTIVAVALAAPMLRSLPFDLDPLHLRSPNADAVATYLALAKEPEIGANAIDVLTPDLNAANSLAQRLSRLPEVMQTKTLSDFVPQDQEQKLKLIHDAANVLSKRLNPQHRKPAPSDRETVEALSRTAAALTRIAASSSGPGAEAARQLSDRLTQLAQADAATRQRAATAFIDPLHLSLEQLRQELLAQPVSVDTLPPDVVSQWRAADGRARVEVLPKGDPNDTDTLRSFARAVLDVSPDAVGPAVFLYEAARTVLRAFIEAGIFALVTIALLLFIVLRRLSDVFLTLVPLLVAGLVTLELCAGFDIALNFANILALPLLLGVGVAFKIYYVEAWRGGQMNLLQSSLTRAIIFSALTTATAFGSLWLSRNPGMSSMGKLMALALVCTLAAAVLFQPALMGPPRKKAHERDGRVLKEETN